MNVCQTIFVFLSEKTASFVITSVKIKVKFVEVLRKRAVKLRIFFREKVGYLGLSDLVETSIPLLCILNQVFTFDIRIIS